MRSVIGHLVETSLGDGLFSENHVEGIVIPARAFVMQPCTLKGPP